MTTDEELNLFLVLTSKYKSLLGPELASSIEEKISTKSTFDFENIVIPEYADVSEENIYILRFCYAFLCQFQDALTDREKNICDMLLVQNDRKLASTKYLLTVERVRQLFINSIKKISESYQKDMKDLPVLRKENEELKTRNYLLENALKLSTKENVDNIEKSEKELCENAITLLNMPITSFPLSTRTINILKRNEVTKFKDIPQLSYNKLMDTENCGRKTATELSTLLNKLSLGFGMKYEDVVSKMKKYNNDDILPIFFTQNSKGRTVEGISPQVGKKELKITHRKSNTERKTVELTMDIIQSARSFSGGFTKDQLIAIGVDWPPRADWISEVVGSMISLSQLRKFNLVEYAKQVHKNNKPKRKRKKDKTPSYSESALDISQCSQAIRKVMEDFDKPASLKKITRKISRSEWGGSVSEDAVFSILLKMNDIEYVENDKFILKDKKDS